MAEGQADGPSKGQVFFDRADQVAETGNWDFAIELYLEGIRRDPTNITRGHQPLRKVSLVRKMQGGKPAGMMDALKHRAGKDPVETLANAEYLMAKEPGSVTHMVAVLKASQGASLNEITNWITMILMETHRQGKPNKQILQLIVDTFTAIEEYGSALKVCEMALQLSPGDAKLEEAQHMLSAKFAIKQGKYEEGGDFTKGVKDMGKQQELAQKDSMVQSQDFLHQQIDRGRAAYLEAPTVPGKVNAFVDALLKTQDDGDENEAMDVLAKAFKDTGAYQFKMKIGDIKIAQMSRRYRKLRDGGQKESAVALAHKLLEFELEEYVERAANYPTDLAIKFELGKRQFLAGKFDDAIGTLQQAQRDPRRHVSALNYLGQCFARKQWYPEAIETYERALKVEVPEDRKKEIFYNLGDLYEKTGDLAKARQMFSDLAQMDFNFRDVRARMDAIRKKAEEQGGAGNGNQTPGTGN